MSDLLKTIRQILFTVDISGSFSTFPEFFSWLRRFPLVHQPAILKQSKIGELSYQTITFSDIQTHMSGNFGHIYTIQRYDGSSSKPAFMKASPEHPNTVYIESLMQCIAHATLSYFGLPHAVPRVLDIVKHPGVGMVATFEKIPGACLLAEYLKSSFDWNIPTLENDKKIFGLLAQVATYLAILESSIGMNHRDINSTNILMVDPNQPVHHTMSTGAYNWTIHADQQAILIDFGFACIGKPGGEMILSAGELLPEIDFCPKEGRDLFLFFANLWNIPAFRNSLTEIGVQCFKRWLRDTSSTRWADWLETPDDQNMVSMYLLTNVSQFRSQSCQPYQVLEDISKLYGSIVEFHQVTRPSTPYP